MASITDVARAVVISLFDKNSRLRRWVANIDDNLFLRLFWPHISEYHPLHVVLHAMNFRESSFWIRLKYPRVIGGRRLVAIYETYVRDDQFGLQARVRVYMGKPKKNSKKEDYVVYWSYGDRKKTDYLFSTVHNCKPFYFAQIGTFFDLFYNFTMANQAMLRWYRDSEGIPIFVASDEVAGEVSDANTE